MVDLSSAFDWISRDFTWEAVRHVIGDSVLITIMEDMYKKTTACMQDNPEDKFETTAGVRQGGTESPYVYNCLAQRCMDTFETKCLMNGIEPFKVPFKIPAEASDTGNIDSGVADINYINYADDSAIFARTEQELKLKLELLQETFEEFGLYMNLSKTETLVFNWKLGKAEKTEKYPENIITLKTTKETGETTDFNIKNSVDFKYLGAYSQQDDSSIGSSELDNRITSATCKFYELKHFFRNHKIHLQTRIKYLHSLVRSRLTYLSAGWTITKVQLEKLDSCYIRFLRNMIKGGWQRQKSEKYVRKKDGVEGEFAKLKITNKEILKIAKIKTISEFVQQRQEDWIGHCVRADNSTFIKQLTFADYFETDVKKRGPMSTTYRQVLKKFEESNYDENEMIKMMKNRVLCDATTRNHNSNSHVN